MVPHRLSASISPDQTVTVLQRRLGLRCRALNKNSTPETTWRTSKPEHFETVSKSPIRKANVTNDNCKVRYQDFQCVCVSNHAI